MEALRRRGQATEAALIERMELLWPAFFAHPEAAPPPALGRIGVACSTDTNAAISGHFPWLERPGALRRAVEAFLPPA